MPRFGVRSIVTYALVGSAIAAMFVGIPPESKQWVEGAALLALGFFFKGDGGSNPEVK